MLNRVILMGRITKDLEVKQTNSGTALLRFTVAVDRPVKQGQEKQADFINCVAWGQRAEFINRYFGKGRMIALEGQIRTGSYEGKDGQTRYTTEVNVDSVSFTGEPRAQDGANSYTANYGNNGGYQNNSYQNNGGYQKSAPNNAPVNNQAPSDDTLSIGDLDDFEEVLSDDGVPF